MCLPRKLSGETVQLIATTIGSLQFFNFGFMFGITPLSIQLYKLPRASPLNHSVSEDATSWLSGYLFLGIAVGSLIFGILANKIGPKTSLVLSGVLQLTSWFCMHFASHIQHIEASRAFNGAGFGGAFTILPIFIMEITKDPNTAARLIALSEYWRVLGLMLGLIFVRYIPYILVPIIGIIVSIAFTLLFPFVQDSPYYLRNEGNFVGMEKALRWYRGIRHEDDRNKPEFLQEVAEFTHETKESQSIVTMATPCAYKMKLVLYCFVMISCVHLCGVYFIFNYALLLFADYNIALIFGAVQLFGAILAAWIGIKINRKILLSLTGLVCGFSLIFLVVADKWEITSMYNALTLSMAFLSIHILSASLGLQPLSLIVTQELLPAKLRAHYTAVISAFSWLVLFGVIQSYLYLSPSYLYVYFAIFAGASFLIVIVAFAFLPDTKTKSTEEVQRDMGFAVMENIARLSTISNGRINENTYL